jgi:hypothetical protein
LHIARAAVFTGHRGLKQIIATPISIGRRHRARISQRRKHHQ